MKPEKQITNLLLILLIVVITNCTSTEKETTKTYTIPQAGWSITVPDYLIPKDPIKLDEPYPYSYRSPEVLEIRDTGLSIDAATLIASFEPLDSFNMIERKREMARLLVLQDFENRTLTDTSLSFKKIGGIEFQKYRLDTKLKNKHDWTYLLYYGIIDSSLLTVIVSYGEKNSKTGKRLIRAVEDSKFSATTKGN